MKRVLIASLSLLVLTLALSLTWLTTSESALHWIYRQIQPRLPGELQVREISGSLGGGFILRDIEFDDGSTRLAADRHPVHHGQAVGHRLEPTSHLELPC